MHAFSGWDGPILTDSGGFQVFSLRDTLLAVDDDGVTFRSVYDGAAERLTPESVAEIQRRLGSDIAMCLDICPPADATPGRARGGRSTHDAVGGAPGRRAPGAGAAALRHRAGRHRSRAAAPVDRRGHGAAVRRLRARAGSRSARAGRRCSTPSAGRRRSCRTIARATSWVSAIPRASSRSSPAGSTCSTACCPPAPRAPGRR